MKFYYANLFAQEQKLLSGDSLKDKARRCRDQILSCATDGAQGEVTPTLKEGLIRVSKTITNEEDWWTLMLPHIIDKGLKTCVDFVTLNFNFRKYKRSLSIEHLGFKDRLVLRLAVETYINLTLNSTKLGRGILREIYNDGDMFFCRGIGDAEEQFNEMRKEIITRKGFVFVPFDPDDEKTNKIDIDFQAMVFLDWVYRSKVRGKLMKEARVFIGNGYFSRSLSNIERVAYYSKMNIEEVALMLEYLLALWDDINTKKLTGPAFLASIRTELAATAKDHRANTYVWITNKLKNFVKMSNKEDKERMEKAKLALTTKH